MTTETITPAEPGPPARTAQAISPDRTEHRGSTADRPGAAKAAIPARHGSRVPARVRIMAWLVFVMAAGLSSVVILVAQFEHRAILERVNRALAQDAREFANFAASGRDPVTGEAITDPGMLFDRYLTVQSTDRSEILLGIVGSAHAPSVRRVVHTSVQDVQLPDDLIVAIIGGTADSGQVATSAGELRWIRTTVIGTGGSAEEARTVDTGAWFVAGYVIDDAVADVTDRVRTLIAVCAAALLLGAGVSWLVAGQILAPVRTVRRAAADLTEDDLTRRIPVQGRDDIAALAEQFNAMLDRLEEAFRIRRAFLDDAGHELRTPITIVRGNLELMGDEPAERAETVRLCTDELDRMARIVDDMLLLAKAEHPDFLRPSWVSVPDLTSDIDAKVRTMAHRTWILDGIGEGEAYLDEQRITQAVVQLAQNAVQHTSAGGVIRMGSSKRTDAVIFWVTDDGPGVPEDEVGRIFERFTRGSAARSDRTGAGLGLAIVRAIAEAHRGRAWVVSDPGHGASFGLELPVVPAPAAADGQDRR